MANCLECDVWTMDAENCCTSHPETGESELFFFPDGSIGQKCPVRTEEGFCTDYAERPDACRSHYCAAHYDQDAFEHMARQHGLG